MPTVTPSPYALSTPKRFLDYFQEPDDSDGGDTDQAQRLINLYSRAIIRYTRRQWKPVETGVSKIFNYSGNGYLSLSPYECRAITTITIYTDLPEAGWQVLPGQDADTESAWRVMPRNKTPELTYWSLIMPEIGRFHPYFDMPVTTLNRNNLGYEVTILGDWGVAAANIPEDVEGALWIACANAWRNPEGYQHRQIGPMSTSDYGDVLPGDEEGLSLPRAARALLKDYRRKSGPR